MLGLLGVTIGEPDGTRRLCGRGGNCTGVPGENGCGERGANVTAEIGVRKCWPACSRERARFVAREGGCAGEGRLRSGYEAPGAAATEVGERGGGGGGGGGYSYCWLMLQGRSLAVAAHRLTVAMPFAAALVSTSPDNRRE